MSRRSRSVRAARRSRTLRARAASDTDASAPGHSRRVAASSWRSPARTRLRHRSRSTSAQLRITSSRIRTTRDCRCWAVEVKSLARGAPRSPKGTCSSRTARHSSLGAHVAPLPTTSTHVVADPTRTRKLLLQSARSSTAWSARSSVKATRSMPLAAALEERQGEARDRARHGQEGSRQACDREGPRLGTREIARAQGAHALVASSG